jgi:ATP-dependent Clp protease ATP-binding subunit ClpA
MRYKNSIISRFVLGRRHVMDHLQNYDVTLEKSIIICTSNYKDIDEIKKELGDAIYNRFDTVIKFEELSDIAKREIANKCINAEADMYAEEKNFNLLEKYRSNLIEAVIKCKNAREIQHLVSNTFALGYIKKLYENI